MYPRFPSQPKAAPPPPSPIITATIHGDYLRLRFLAVAPPEFRLRLVPAPDISDATRTSNHRSRVAGISPPWGGSRREPDPPDGAVLAPWPRVWYRNCLTPVGSYAPCYLASIPDLETSPTATEVASLLAGGLRLYREGSDLVGPPFTAAIRTPMRNAGDSRAKAAAEKALDGLFGKLGFCGKWSNKAPDLLEKTLLGPWVFLAPAVWEWCNNGKRRRGAAKTKTTEDAENGALGRA